ncbi:MAG: peptide deformylase [Candidatus Magasanikbacteria bacterium CG_4_9_14_0_2_um_filter_42_11]|uniref:Peptide deformylase n=1 Tax=Candidatus Magasanikbacteria bacterium CG_4_9_14_0_2_um_filter_42_11 TaxID=1974643 RepID=A0A2M8F940_9BACT|nr:MAG: peptide deformylase [Candidatus Magasanikbacteria bacterium CG10_big_fil_rev_8_21_14_0_10_43_9]PIY92658.1 MAG: peptide deformylase [Candidatus Magasanikbacteria bacterium CG_4_10_14_0_8_um_filter_42_12]PJC52218.1 MAG: peptide deformylase [Candidatus Magasanikbacteria bacterium CG_4_9_14_0_2_um_filter_42_11]
MILPLTEIPTPSLHEPSRTLTKKDVLSQEIQKLIENMIPTMYKEQGIGLAAPQVGVNVKLCIIGKDAIPENFVQKDPNKDLVLINPVYQRMSRKAVLETEGCLSVPGQQGKVKRYKQVHVEALDEQGDPISFNASGYLAHVAQHETDHLNGILYIDKAETTWEIE